MRENLERSKLRSALKTLRGFAAALFAVVVPLALGACQQKTNPQPAYPPYGQQPYPGAYPQQPYPQQPYPQQPVPQQPAPASSRPLLAPLIGIAAWQSELRTIMSELVNALQGQNKALVNGIPLVFDPTTEVNAFAGCENGAPFMAATSGILEAADAMAQTKATDELFGTQTYDAYCNSVLPAMARSPTARAALPQGIIPTQFGGDARRWSRAHELFDEILAFTFGHELAHHYLGHTGCAKGQGPSAGPDPAALGRVLTNIPLFNQAAETHADAAGAYNALDAGRARRPGYEWQEAGGLTLLDYFARLERASGGGGPLSLLSPSAFLRTHPNPLARGPILQGVARTWHQQHP